MLYVRENIITKSKSNSIHIIELKFRLEEALKKNPPISLKDFISEYHYIESNIRRYFPEECKQVSYRYISYIKKRKEQRIIDACKEVRQITKRLHEMGVYPSQVRVEKEMSNISGIFYPIVRQAHKEMLRHLGYRK